MTVDQLLVILLIGLVAGFAATHLVAGHGYGLVGDIVVGVIGAFLGSLLLGHFIDTVILVPLGIATASVLGEVIVAFVGAAILLLVLRLVSGGGFGGRRFGRRRL